MLSDEMYYSAWTDSSVCLSDIVFAHIEHGRYQVEVGRESVLGRLRMLPTNCEPVIRHPSGNRTFQMELLQRR